MKFKKNKKGFTLVELIVVIAILAILASAATVATVAILNNARRTPVTDTANSVKGQISNWYVALSDTNAKWDPTKESCLGGYLKGVFTDAVVETAVKSFNENTSAPITDDSLHIATTDLGTTNGKNYKKQGFTVYVYSRYYFIPITVTVTDGVGTPSVGEIVKWK